MKFEKFGDHRKLPGFILRVGIYYVPDSAPINPLASWGLCGHFTPPRLHQFDFNSEDEWFHGASYFFGSKYSMNF
jgi:hypothetical protein